MSEEVWKSIEFNSTYSVSDNGRVRNDKTGRILKNRYDSNGYDRANLQGKDYKVHRLVAIHFLPEPPPELVQVNHIDGNKSNNNVSNLEWCTNQYNALHSFRIGIRNHLLKLSDEDVRSIRDRNLNYKDVMKEYGISQSHSSAVINKTRREVV